MIEAGVFAIEISGPDDYRSSHSVAWEELTIGRAGHNDVVLDHPSIGMRHIRILHRPPATLILYDIFTEHGTTVDGRIVKGASHALVHGSRVRAGEFDLVFTWVASEVLPETPTPTEAELVAAIERHDPDSRTVYADWLEERGQTARAEFLRVEDVLLVTPQRYDIDVTIRRDALLMRLRELATVIDPAWRARVSCAELQCRNPKCPQHWGALETTELPHVRACSVCEQRLVYCATVDEARAQIRTGNRVVLDVLCPASFGM
jgi:uncharacterized protein (TIGR02996 family)